MRRDDFVQAHQPLWDELAELLDELDAGRSPSAAERMPAVYRQVCQSLALARSRGYGTELVDELNALVLRAYHQLYGRRVVVPSEWLRYALEGVIGQLRKDRRLFIVSMLLFFVPFLGTIAAVQIQPELAFAFASPDDLAGIEAMYDRSPAQLREGRESGSDLYMFGFYIRNNVGIGFRTFAGGALFGLGSLFFLLFNGFYLGAMIGHVMAVGHGETFWQFAIGHGSFELTAIALSGYCGLKVGLAMLSPGRRTRARAMYESAQEALGVIYVAFAMLVIAAFIEAFWSSSGLPLLTKWLVGGSLWLIVGAYLGRALQRGEPAAEAP